MNESTNYAERISAAAQALRLTTEVFQKLFDERMGFDNVADLDDENLFKFGYFMKKFEDYPMGLVRKAFVALKGGKAEKTPATDEPSDNRLALFKALGLKNKPEAIDPALLLPHYLPGKLNDQVSLALRARFGDKAVIALREDGTVALNETLRYISGLEQGYPEQDSIMVEGRLTKLWPVGVKPNVMVEEDPLFPGRPLNAGLSTVNNRNWSGIPHHCRQLCRIIADRGDVDVNNKEAVLRLMERAKDIDSLTEAYPEADLQHRQLKERDELPKLRVPLGSLTDKQNNPFGVKRNY